MQKLHFSHLVLLTLGLACVPINAQDAGSQAADNPAIPADDFDRGTPHRSFEGFLAAAGMGDYETAAEYLDLRNLRGEASKLTGAQLARQFNVIVKRSDWVGIDELIDDPAGRSNDGLPDYRDSIGVILDEDKEVRLLMQKVPRGDGVSIWKISNATGSLIPSLYKRHGYPETVENLRRTLPDVSFLGYELFKWVVLLAVAVLTYGAVLLLATLVRRILDKWDSPSQQKVYRFLLIPFGTWVVIISVHATTTRLGRSITAADWEEVSPIPILVTVWVLYACLHVARDIYAAHLQEIGRPGALVLLQPAASAGKVIVAIIAIVIYLHKLGINVATLIAGLGVGGIAVALALQKPMEDMFGALTLYTQQPVRVGDFCRIGDCTGTIEEIGLRTTRIRTLAHTLVAIPNYRLVNEPIDNISARGNIRYRQILLLRYDTTPEQIRDVLEGIRELLSSHERVIQDDKRVRFNEFAKHSLSVEVNAYLTTTNWAEYLKLAEELNMGILEIISQTGTSLFMPVELLPVE